MITLKSLTECKELHKSIGSYLRDKCCDYNLAKNDSHYMGCSYGMYPDGRFSDYFVGDDVVIVYFKDMFHRDGERYELPLDILFNDDFYEIMKARFESKQKVNEEIKKKAELQILKELKNKYPENYL